MINPQHEISFEKVLNHEHPEYHEPAMRFSFHPQIITNTKIKTILELQKLYADCIVKINEIIREVQLNNELQEYFQKAEIAQPEILAAYKQIIAYLTTMKVKINEPNTNLVVVGDIFAMIVQLLTKNTLYYMTDIEKAIWILKFQTSVSATLSIMVTSLEIPMDVTMQDKQKYPEVWKHIKKQKLMPTERAQQGLQQVRKMATTLIASCIDESKYQSLVSKFVSFGLSIPQYHIFSDKEAQLKSMKFFLKPTLEIAQNFLNASQTGLMRSLSKLTFQSIQESFKIFIPFDSTQQPKNIFVNDGQSLTIRVFHNNQLHPKLEEKSKRKKSIFGGCCSSMKKKVSQRIMDTIIVHMHGGGFIASSSRGSQPYNRIWANQLGIPIFSIDYRMPQDHRFPTAPYDCLNAYKFIVKNIHKYFNVKPTKIIITGESAGGNLAVVLTSLIMKQKLPMPHGIFLLYPSTDLRSKFSPSKLFAFSDPFITPVLLKISLNQYLNSKLEECQTPLASPVLISQQFIGGAKGDKRFPLKWPKTIIQVGEDDPLYDDSIKLMERMVESKIDCQCQVYEDLPHAFVHFIPFVPEYKKTVFDTVINIKKLLQ